jgi:hypothetical protein
VFVHNQHRHRKPLYEACNTKIILQRIFFEIARKHWLKSVCCHALSVMPTLENKLPEVNHRTLTRRAARSQAVIGIARATLPGQMVLRLRRSAERMADLVEDTTAPAHDRISAARAMVTLQDQLMDLLAIPRRPAASTGRGKSSIPIDISPATLVGSPQSLPDLD